MATISVELDPETMLKLTRRAARVNMTPRRAFREIATRGPQFFLNRLVAPTTHAERGKSAARRESEVRTCAR